MTKEEVARELDGMVDGKRLFTRSMTLESNYAANRRVVKGEYHKTAHPCVFASDKEAAAWFDGLFNAGAIMSTKTAAAYYPKYDAYGLSKACMCGVLLKYTRLKGAAIYINNAE